MLATPQQEIKALSDDIKTLAQAILELADSVSAEPHAAINHRDVVVPHIRKVATYLLRREERRTTSTEVK